MLTHTLDIRAHLDLPAAAVGEVRAVAQQLLPTLEARLRPWYRLVDRLTTTDGDTLDLQVVVAADLDLPASEAQRLVEETMKPRLADLFQQWAWTSPFVVSASIVWHDTLTRDGAPVTFDQLLG